MRRPFALLVLIGVACGPQRHFEPCSPSATGVIDPPILVALVGQPVELELLLPPAVICPQGNPVATNDAIQDFNLNNLGFQIRYRYELAPLSDLFVVYSRGGFGFEQDNPRDPLNLLGDAFSLHDNEMFLVKLSYRFSI